jgi:hypothetical protein
VTETQQVPDHERAQAEARAQKKGMWARGTPSGIVSSLHSADEGKAAYNRVVDARTLGQHFRETESQTVSPPAPAPDSASCIAIGRMDSHTPDMSACHADG